MTPTQAPELTALPPASRNLWRMALLALAMYSAFNLLLPQVPPPHRAPLGVVIAVVLSSTAAFMLLQLWLAFSVAAARPRPLVSGVGAVACVALFAGFYTLSVPYGQNPPLVLQFLQGLMVTLGCTFLGLLLSPIIREPNVLLPVALIAMPIDYLGAMTSIGFTSQVVKNHPNIVKGISVPVPSVGASAHHGGLHPVGFIGPGDILFVAFFFAVVLRLNLNGRGTFWWIYGLLTATMIFVLSPGGFNIAALVPMGLAVLLANFRYFKLRREEVFATLYAGLLIIALVTGFYLYYTHTQKHRPAVTETQTESRSVPRNISTGNAPKGATP